ncbi:flagellar assembly protein FliH [Humidesulfovibrio mexicanus]|uniref:Flagellar assembly protein FliH n=1 Tax=Humidesulfovibrio mexicanus TaxID=147047 RepID=A0A239APF2_9BACT|nr:FliH/SctL family protein [Humidesulfovibrio mexicanus]SNR97221.1 flagellar assembly protein FliH [Humidesulfovibrio mexicanus]
MNSSSTEQTPLAAPPAPPETAGLADMPAEAARAIPAGPRYSGRVLMGCDSPGPGFVTIQEIEGKRHRPVWDEATEAEYIDRCTRKAEALAREIINQAMHKAEAQAQAIRETEEARVAAAVAEAQHKAETEAQARLDAEVDAHVQAMDALISGIQTLGQEVWAARRKDFATLAKAFARRALGLEMETRRAEILEHLMDEACARLDAHRAFTLKVAPEDFELAQTLLQSVQARRPDLGQWQLAADPGMTLGGVCLETQEMLADNDLGNRLALLEPYLEQLSLPEDLAQARAEAAQHESEAPGVPES